MTGLDGMTSLDWARRKGHTEVVDYLESLPQSSSQPGEQSWMSEHCVFVVYTT